MLDTGATHNFIAVEEAQRLGLKGNNGGGSIKAVNSPARPIHDVVRGVKTCVGAWCGNLNFSIVPIDDFKVVLGLEFYDQVKAIPMPFTNSLCFTEGDKACVVPTTRGTKQDLKVLSALQFKKDIKREEDSYLAKSWHEQMELAQAALHKAATRMKKWADKKRRHVEFKEGDLVLVKLLPQQFKSLRKVHKGLVRKNEGLFEVIKRIGKVSYKLHLPPKLKIHPVFHVSMLKLFHEDEEDPSRGVSHRVPTAIVTSFDKEVDEILADQVIRRRGMPSYKEYLIKWRGLLDTEACWESEDILWQFKDKIQHYNEGTMKASRA
ncbi:hypothetical protein ACLB2K_059458 [Fragaria x ananassa]